LYYYLLIKCKTCSVDQEIFSSKKESFSIHYVYLSEMIEKRTKNVKSFLRTSYKYRSKLKEIKCTSCVSNDLVIKKCLLEAGKVIVISFIACNKFDLSELYDKIDKKIFLNDIYDMMEIDCIKKMYILKGFVCFKNKHYIYASYINKSWILINDETVTKFENWGKMKEKLVKLSWFPSLLFYEDLEERIDNSRIEMNRESIESSPAMKIIYNDENGQQTQANDSCVRCSIY